MSPGPYLHRVHHGAPLDISEFKIQIPQAHMLLKIAHNADEGTKHIQIFEPKIISLVLVLSCG